MVDATVDPMVEAVADAMVDAMVSERTVWAQTCNPYTARQSTQ